MAKFLPIRVTEDGSSVVTNGEYFWDADPGFGGGQGIALSDLASGTIGLETDGLSLGLHTCGLRLQNASGQWGVTLWDTVEICTNFNVTAAFDLDLFGSTLYATDGSAHADSIVWSISGSMEAMDSTWNPTFELNAGDYAVTQTVWNECDQRSQTDSVTVRGVTSVLPEVGALGISTTFQAVGAFDDLTDVEVSNGAWSDAPAFSFTADGLLRFTVTFPDSIAEAVGAYDICTTFADGSVTCFEAGIEVGAPEVGLLSTISGPGAGRLNVITPYTVTVENTGNMPLYGVPLGLLVSGPAEVWYPFTPHLDEMEGWADDSLWNTIDIVQEVLEHHAMRVYWEEEADSTWVNTTWIPVMMPGVPVSFNFDLKVTAIGEGHVTIRTQMGNPWFTAADFSDYLSVSELPGPVAAEMMMTECDMLPPCIDFIHDLASMANPVVACGLSAFNIGCAIGECVNAAGGAGYGGTVEDQCLKDMGMATLSLLGCSLTPANVMRVAARRVVKSINEIDSFGDVIEGTTAPLDCEDCFTNRNCGGDDGSAEAVVACDPNEKSGLLGYGEDRFIPILEAPIPYRIECENVDSATAPAAVVRMLDTLDLSTFDASSVTWERFGFADTMVSVHVQGNRFVREVDLQPAKNAVLRVEGEVNLTSGVLEVVWTSLDPVTRTLTYEIDAGFLNPNASPPEGEAYIDFTVELLPEAMYDGAVLSNTADIYFDANEGIRTADWVNTLDGSAPHAEIMGAEAHGDSTLQLLVALSDAGSGVRYVDVYRDTLTSDTSGFAALLIGRFPAGDTLLIDVMPSDTIHLFTRAVDGVGNEELLNWTEGITAMIEWVHIPVVCAADFDEDEMVSIADLLGLLSSYGTSDATYDLTGDGEVGLADFLAFLQQYGTFCPN